MKSEGPWPATGSEAYVTLGGATDTWVSAEITGAAVKDASFGFRLTADTSAAGGATAQVDHVRVTIWWDPGPGGLKRRRVSRAALVRAATR